MTLACSGILWHNQCIILTADGAYHCPVGSIWVFFLLQLNLTYMMQILHLVRKLRGGWGGPGQCALSISGPRE